MSNFFDGIEPSTEFSTGAIVIPDNTHTKAKIKDLEYKTPPDKFLDEWGGEYISLTWIITEGEYRGIEINSSVKINHVEESVKIKAKKMIAALITICGGDIRSIKGSSIPDVQLAKMICGTPMKVIVSKMETKKIDMEGKDKVYVNNYISRFEKIDAKKDEDGDDIPM